ncbi:hypothetical protein [Parasulfitobacter algicola]|uniref:Uncharacterized protein n=1 Tax=Parasulfitobacter algicola TaxID=2614809 RepID=A0ABX2IVG9_9RHOB|nr:hypothetical protein [Sulfitobacter algicola]NSX56926.1 hypothetical protein [Sulfitobacter algicola]
MALNSKTKLAVTVERWLARNNTIVGPNSANYDHKLETFLSDADSDFLLAFFYELSRIQLTDTAISILGAGLMEDFLARYPNRLDDFKSLIRDNQNLMDAACCMLPRDDMTEKVNQYVEMLIDS